MIFSNKSMFRSFPFLGFFIFAAAVFSAKGQTAPPKVVDSFLEKHCFECHDDSVSKGDLNLLELDFNLAKPASFEMWTEVYQRVKSGEMPPRDEPRPKDDFRKSFLANVRKPLHEIDRALIAKTGRVRGRRLTRGQYQQTVHDFLGIDIPLIDHLPEEPSPHRFETIADHQQISHHLLAKYLDVAEMALTEAFGRVKKGDRKYEKTINARMLGRGSWKGGNYRGPEDKDGRAIAWPLRLQFYGRMPATRVSESGWYEVTLKGVQAVNSDVVWGTLKSGACSSSAPILYSIGTVEATRQKRDLTFQAWIKKDHMLEMKPADATIPRAKIATTGGSVNFKGSNLLKAGTKGIAMTGIKMTRIYPYANQWRVRQNLIGKINPKDLEKASQAEREKLVESTIHRFANRAFRRPVSNEQTKPYVDLARAVLREKDAQPSEALFTAYRAILCSPRFLTFYEKPGRLDQHALASRISYLLWNTMPDQELRSLADQGKLEGQAIYQQTSRLLSDPRSDRFIAAFTDQWLKLKEIDFTSPDSRRFRTFDPVVQESLVEETRAFFGELIRKNLSVKNIIHSDFAMLNERLVRFYSMKNMSVKPGSGLMRVSLGGNPRGGLITQGSILKVTADGTTTSPIVRGVYLGERILGIEIPPPPPGVPAVEPDIRGAFSIRDQLAKHSTDKSCASCHAKIDPAGFAMENFDPVGLWRSKYGTKKNSPKVDSSGRTPDGKPFKNVLEWKKIYLNQPDRLTRAFAEQLLTYAIGGELRFSDEEALEKIVSQAREKNYGMRTVLNAVIYSEPFRTK